MLVTRVYADSSGESHFEDVEVRPSMHDSAPVTGRMVFVDLPPGWLADWHPAPRRQYWIGSVGAVEVTVSDGDTREFGPGSIALLEDLIGKGHVTRAVGGRGVQALLVQL